MPSLSASSTWSSASWNSLSSAPSTHGLWQLMLVEDAELHVRPSNLGSLPPRSIIEPDLGPEKRVSQRHERRGFLVVLAIAVAAGRGLVEIGLVAHGLQLGGHLAGVAGMHAVVRAGRGQQDRRIAVPRRRQVIGRIGLQEGPVLRPCPGRRTRRSSWRRPAACCSGACRSAGWCRTGRRTVRGSASACW